MWIKSAEDFGLAFNCMSRMYMRNYEEKYLEMMVEIIDIYLKYFSSRTIVCSLRDFVEESRWNNKNKTIPNINKEKLDYIVKRLVRQGLMLDKLDSRCADDDERIFQFGQEIYFCNHWAGNSKFDRNTFLNWVHDNKLNEDLEHKIIIRSDNVSLPLKKTKINILINACMTMLEYSYGRHTYMPSTCVSFIKLNWDILPESFLRKVQDFLQIRNEAISDDAPIIEKIDDETWLLFEEEISMELISRDSYRKARDIELSKIEEYILKLDNTKSIKTQRKCKEVIASLDGIKRYVDTADCKVRKDTDLAYELVHSHLVERLLEIWKREEGHLYTEIAEGVYVRKKQEHNV